MFPYASNTLVPAMLHVCFEARKVGMKFYKQINHYASENDDTTSIGRTFVNFNVDIILLETADTVKRFDNSTPKWGVALQGKNIITENCKLLAVVCKEARTLPERLKSPVRMNFDKLRTLYVVDKYTQHMGDSKTGNLSIVDMPEGSREQGFTHFQLEVQELRKDFVYVKMKNPLLMKAVEAVRDNHKLMDETYRKERERRENEAHEKEKGVLGRPEPGIMEALFDELGAEIGVEAMDKMILDLEDFEIDGGDGAEDADDPDERYAAELQACLDRGQDIDDM